MEVSWEAQGSWIQSWLNAMIRSEPKLQKTDLHQGDRRFRTIVTVSGVLLLVLLAAIAFFLIKGSIPAIKHFGFAFLWTSKWDPVQEIFGAMPLIYGTVVSSLLGMLLAVPLSIGVALFLNELAPRWIGRPAGFLVEMLAAIPSVVYGLWGIFVLAPLLRTTVQPWLKEHLGFLPLFQGPAYGVGMMTAGIILAIMVTPTISSLAREVFRAIPRAQREAAWALGATRWEAMVMAVLKSSKPGLFGASLLGLGRAVGETMAVTMVIGNRSEIVASLFAPSQTMASVLANEYAEASSQIHLSALIEVGLVLFAVTFVMNAFARLMIVATNKKQAHG